MNLFFDWIGIAQSLESSGFQDGLSLFPRSSERAINAHLEAIASGAKPSRRLPPALRVHLALRLRLAAGVARILADPDDRVSRNWPAAELSSLDRQTAARRILLEMMPALWEAFGYAHRFVSLHASLVVRAPIQIGGDHFPA